jgi:putative addiction module CopG family antidote
MQLPLTPELQSIIDEAVRSGRYATPLDAAREAFALFEENEAKFRALKAEIDKGLGSPDADPVDENLARSVKQRGRAGLAKIRDVD